MIGFFNTKKPIPFGLGDVHDRNDSIPPALGGEYGKV